MPQLGKGVKISAVVFLYKRHAVWALCHFGALVRPDDNLVDHLDAAY